MRLYDPTPAANLIRRHEALVHPYECEFGGARLAIDRGVFCPVLTRTSRILLEAVDFRPGERVLDAFCGSGAFGIVAGLRGASAILVDRSKLAIGCAQRNALRNGVEARVEARIGDFRFENAVMNGLSPDDRFDLVIANPPLLPGSPNTSLAAALFDVELRATTTFISGLPRLLLRRGRAFLLTSDVFERSGLQVEALCAARGLCATQCSARDYGYESYRVHVITRTT